MTTQKIYVGIDNDKIELTGKAKEDYLSYKQNYSNMRDAHVVYS